MWQPSTPSLKQPRAKRCALRSSSGTRQAWERVGCSTTCRAFPNQTMLRQSRLWAAASRTHGRSFQRCRNCAATANTAYAEKIPHEANIDPRPCRYRQDELQYQLAELSECPLDSASWLLIERFSVSHHSLPSYFRVFSPERISDSPTAVILMVMLKWHL